MKFGSKIEQSVLNTLVDFKFSNWNFKAFKSAENEVEFQLNGHLTNQLNFYTKSIKSRI